MQLDQNGFESFYTDDEVHEVGTMPIALQRCRLAFRIADGLSTTRFSIDLTIDDAEQLVFQLYSALAEMRGAE